MICQDCCIIDFNKKSFLDLDRITIFEKSSLKKVLNSENWFWNMIYLWCPHPSVVCEAGQYKNTTMIFCSKCPIGTEATVTKTGCGE